MTPKLLIRDLWAGTLRRVPVVLLQPFRHLYISASQRSLRRRLLRPMLSAFRYRQPDGAWFEPLDCPGLRLGCSESIIVRRLYWLGREGYEGNLGALWQYWAKRSSSILEIGANIGCYTVQAALAAPNTRYRAVEAHPAVADELRSNLDLNGLQQVQVVESAVVAEQTAETVELFVPAQDRDPMPTGSWLRWETNIDEEAVASFQVATVEAKSLIDGVDLLKIDVEGLEEAILRSVRDWLVEKKPTVFVEVLDCEPGLKKLIADLCREGGFEVHAIAPDGARSGYPGCDRVDVTGNHDRHQGHAADAGGKDRDSTRSAPCARTGANRLSKVAAAAVNETDFHFCTCGRRWASSARIDRRCAA